MTVQQTREMRKMNDSSWIQFMIQTRWRWSSEEAFTSVLIILSFFHILKEKFGYNKMNDIYLLSNTESSKFLSIFWLLSIDLAQHLALFLKSCNLKRKLPFYLKNLSEVLIGSTQDDTKVFNCVQ